MTVIGGFKWSSKHVELLQTRVFACRHVVANCGNEQQINTIEKRTDTHIDKIGINICFCVETPRHASNKFAIGQSDTGRPARARCCLHTNRKHAFKAKDEEPCRRNGSQMRLNGGRWAFHSPLVRLRHKKAPGGRYRLASACSR